MYGSSSKFGRGGGVAARGGGGKRPHSSFPPPPHRSSGPSGGRLSLGGSSGGSRHRPAAGASSGPQSVEETFSLIPGKNPLAFAMIIRLTPDLVDEIRRVESLGETPRIKFDANANNTSGNVIDVGGKEFRFKWSREDADLCDIYEERQSGEDGNGLLVEYGSAWRKLNVQRVLDESTSTHVKMRSEEAERKLKSRKAILVDHGNPSMKSQIKQLAAVETSPWKMFKQKKEPPFKKQKVEPPQGGLPKPAYKSGLASTTVAKSKRPASPLPSPPEQVGASVSPFGTLKTAKGHVNLEDIMPSQVTDRETAASSEKEIQTKAAGVARETPVRRGNFGAKPKDLHSLLITLLTENPKGMSLKALEKAVGDTMPKSAKKIEPIIKRIATFQAPGRFILKQGIATFQAPGRYILKQGVDFESYKKPSSDNGSSPEDNRHQTPAPDNNSKTALEDRSEQTPARESSFDGKIPTGGFEEQTQLNKVGDDINSSEKIDILQLSPNLASERRGSDNSDKRGVSSSSGSDSDSESDSSDSGSDSGSHSKSRSRSRSKSKSPVGSGRVSSSDSDSDASSDSKQGSDEDVDIMTSDDDKEPKNKLQASEPRLSILPDPWGGTPDGIASQNGLDELKDDQECDVVEIEKDLPGDGRKAELPSIPSSVSQRDSEKRVEEAKSISPDRDEPQDRQNIIESLFEDEENVVEDDLKLEQSPSSERISKGKSSKGSDSKHFNEQSEHAKRLKAESLAQPPVVGSKDAQFSRSPRSSSPGRNTELGTQKGYNQAIPVKSSSDFHQSGQRPYDQSGRARGQDAIERSDKHAVILGSGRKQADKNIVHESFSMQKDKAYRDASNEDGYVNERKALSNSKEESGGKYSGPSDLHYRKHNDMAGKFKEFGQDSNSHIGSSPKNNRIGVNRSPLANGRSSFLQRELSDLELGELREPMPEEPPPKKQFERKSSFKQSENKLNATENWNSDSSRGKYVGKAPFDSGKPSPPNFSSGLRANLDALSRKKTPEQHVEDVTRSYNRVAQSQMQNASRADQAELVSQSNKQTDFSSKSRQNESGAVQGFGMEGSGESHKKAPIIAPQYHDIGRGPVPYQIKDNKRPTTNTAMEMTEGHRDVVLAEGNNSERKRRDSYSDEISCSYSKYEKDKPDLKGPIKDFAQYKEYVQEYHDKFDSYCSLNKILENYRNEFQKLGKDLELAKDRDMDRYHNIVRQLKESYQQCGEKHKRLKKIFVVLHEELKTLKLRIKDFAYTKD